MLTIKLSPVRADVEPLAATWTDPVLTVNGAEYDLSELPDGATAVHPVLGNVARDGDDYLVTLTLPHGSNAPHSTRFPGDIVVTANGAVEIPEYNEVIV